MRDGSAAVASERLWRSIVTIGMNLRNILSGSILAAAMAVALVTIPGGAQAKSSDAPASGMYVCNTASHNGTGGDLVVDALDQQDPVHNGNGLKAKQNGNYNAAEHSRALSLCSKPSDDWNGESVTPPVDNGGLTGANG